MKIQFQFNISVRKKTDAIVPERISAVNKPFSSCAAKEIDNARERGSYSTAANYETALRSLFSFLGRNDMKVGELTADIVEDYQKWLLRRNVSLNTISCYMRSLRSMYNRVTDGETKVFAKAFTGTTTTYKRSLCINDIQRLMTVELPPKSRLSLTRDLFLFSFYCQGMPFVDLAFLKESQIENGQITYHRRKTGQVIRINIEPCMATIIGRYDDPNREYVFPILKSTDYRTAYMQYQRQLAYYNLSLKRLGERAGIKHALTSYVARHTWASIAFQNNVELQAISRAMGHTNPMTTMIYIKELDNSYMANANRMIITACNVAKNGVMDDTVQCLNIRDKQHDVL